jgi:hypothetical protein
MAKMSEQERILFRTLYRALDLRGWIFAAVTTLAVWVVGVLLPLRLAVLLSLLGIAASIVGIVISARAIKAGRRDPLFPIWLGAGLGSLFRFFGMSNAYTFFNEPFYPFWKLALILGLAVGVLVTVKWAWKNTGFWLRLGSILATSFLAFFLVLIMICHLNLLLDFTPPIERQMVIMDKNEQDNGRSSDTYYFEFWVDGNPFELEVGLVEYLLYEEGDTYTFKEYKGAFGKPFYARD